MSRIRWRDYAWLWWKETKQSWTAAESVSSALGIVLPLAVMVYQGYDFNRLAVLPAILFPAFFVHRACVAPWRIYQAQQQAAEAQQQAAEIEKAALLKQIETLRAERDDAMRQLNERFDAPPDIKAYFHELGRRGRNIVNGPSDENRTEWINVVLQEAEKALQPQHYRLFRESFDGGSNQSMAKCADWLIDNLGRATADAFRTNYRVPRPTNDTR